MQLLRITLVWPPTPNTSTNSNTALEQTGRSTAIIHNTGLSVLVLVSAY